MFEDSLVDDKIKTHRGATAIVAFILQVIVIAVIVLIPLVFTQALPINVHDVTMLVAPPPPPPPPPPPAAAPAAPHVAKVTPPVTNELTEPLRIPKKIAMVHEEPANNQPATAPSIAGVPGGVPGGVAGGVPGGMLGGVMGSMGTGAVPKLEAPKKVRVSQGVSEGLLVHKVTPQYPSLAKQARIQGDVVLHAEIGKNGKVEQLQVVRGQPLLTAAAIDAVKQWQYKPYFLNGEPVAVDTTITVNFELNG